MKNVRKNTYSFLLLLALIFLSTACTREAQKSTSKVTIQFPNSSKSNILSVNADNKVVTQKPNFDYTNIPSNYSQVDCLIVFIGGPEDMMRNNYCEKSSDKTQHFNFGVFAGTIAKDQTISLEVPSGSSRYIRLFGMKKPTAASLCPTINAEGSDTLLSGFSAPYFLGESAPTEMLPGANISVDIPVVAAIDSSAFFDDCKGPSFGSGTTMPGGGSTDSNKPYLRIEGLHNFNKIENPSFARPMARGACYPVTFKTFKPCSGGQCEPYTLQNILNINIGTNIKFFTFENDCQTDVNPISTFTMAPGQSQIPTAGSYFMRIPLGHIGMINTNLGNEISLSATTEVNFNQPSFTNIDIVKPKIVVSNLPSSITYGSCASGTNTTISAFEDTAATIPMNSHQNMLFDGLFLMAKELGCAAQVSAIPTNLSSVTVNLAKPVATASGVTGLQVNTIIYDSNINKYYIGGSFTNYGGKNYNNIMRINPDGSYDPSFDAGIGFDADVYSIISDGTGGVFVAGTFTSYKGVTVKSLARLDQNGNLDLGFGFDIIGPVYTMKLSGNILYIGGFFNLINGQTRNNIASIDVSTKTLTNWNPNASSMVKAIEIDGSIVYAGGGFTNIGGQVRNKIGAVDAITGLATSWNPNSNNSVTAIAINGTNVFVGGAFSTIGGSSRSKIAALDSATGIATAWNPNSSGNINTIEINAPNVYVGGTFITIGGQSRTSLASLDISTGLATAWNPNISGTNIFSIKTNGSNVIFGGVFTYVGGATANKIAAVNNTTGSLVATELNPYWGSLIFNSLFYDFAPFSIPQ